MKHLVCAVGILSFATSTFAIETSNNQYTDKAPYQPGSNIPLVITQKQIKWQTLPSGVKIAYLVGHPTKKGPFVLRLHYPVGFKKAPHYHPYTAYISVLAGEYHRGYGAVFDKSKAVALQKGTFSVNPAKAIHYEWASKEAIIEVHAQGPWSSTYVDKEGNSKDMNQQQQKESKVTM
jgi:ChrR Cupin-like domain